MLSQFSERKVTKKSEEWRVKNEEFAVLTLIFLDNLQCQQPYSAILSNTLITFPSSFFIFYFSPFILYLYQRVLFQIRHHFVLVVVRHGDVLVAKDDAQTVDRMNL